VVPYHRLAEASEQCNEYLRKGSKVYIEGRLQTREWQGQDGQNRQTVEVVANEMVILDSRQTGPGGPSGGYGEDRPPRTGGGGGPAEPGGFDDDSDVDDIPF